MPLNLLHDIDPADLVAFARAVPERADFRLTQSVLPTRVIRNVKYRTRNQRVTVHAAKFRAFNAPTPFITVAAARSIREGFLPPLGGKEAIEEFEAILAEIDRGADDQRLVDALYDNIQNQVIAIRSRLELAAGDLLTDGVIEISENGQDYDVDFGVPPAHLPAPSIPWTDAEARRLDDELGWIQTIADGGQSRAGRVLTSRRVISGFASNVQYKGTYWGEVDGTNRPNLTVEQLNSVRGQYQLPPLEEYDVAIPVEGQGLVRVLPESAYLVLPAEGEADTLGSTTYGLTAEGILLSRGSNPSIVSEDAPGIIATSEESDDPVSVTTKSTAVALPLLDAPTAYVAAEVF